MVKMAHAPLPKPVCRPLNTSTMCPTDFTASSVLSDVLNSDPVKRLFNQPNIVIKTVTWKPPEASVLSNNNVTNKTSISSITPNELKQPEMTEVFLKMEIEDNNEDENLLPSKKDGKSEIALVPIKREKKPCGHYEPCENIVCDVAVQQYVDRDRASPMLAISIEEDEINAPVAKHCTNEKCDALSIDHDRCRRAVIKLNRCNRSSVCDICGVTLKTPRSRIYHKNCTRKNEYRHNEVDSAQILKERMREREIQIMEAFKAKKNDYLDPIRGNNLAMEALKNNEELIIIPKSVPIQQPAITINTVTATTQPTQPKLVPQPTSQITNVNNVFRNILPNIPIVLPQQSIVIGKTPCSNENNITTPVQVALPDALNRPLITTSNAVPLPQNQYLTFATQHNSQSITINDILFSQSQFMTTPIQPKPLLTPIRVVPITNLITQPSLLHQTQGIPKFCIMADNTVTTPITIANPQPVQQPVPVPKVSIPQNSGVVQNNNTKPVVQKKRKTLLRKKRKLKRKDFKCDYCLKRFSTDWYFKIHVAKHTGEKQFSCKICTQSFSNRYDMKRHMASKHKDENVPSDTQDQQPSEKSCKCGDCNMDCASFEDLKHHREKCHGVTECSLCHKEISIEELDRHISLIHKESESSKMKDIKDVTENNDSSSETNKLPSNNTKMKINNCDLKQEDNINKMNGCMPIFD
ncbi:uncharacterized protein LOC143179102 isoform X2 [Calliopsis andreniformis]